MKRFLLLLVALPGLIYAQNMPIGNFYLENQTVVYRHIFKDSLDSANVIGKKIMSSISRRPGIKNMVQSGWVITGNYDELNHTTFDGSETRGDFTIEIKNGKYRLTILNLRRNNSFNLAVFNPFDYTYARDSKAVWRPTAQQDLGVIDEFFTNLFTLYPEPIGSDW